MWSWDVAVNMQVPCDTHSLEHRTSRPRRLKASTPNIQWSSIRRVVSCSSPRPLPLLLRRFCCAMSLSKASCTRVEAMVCVPLFRTDIPEFLPPPCLFLLDRCSSIVSATLRLSLFCAEIEVKVQELEVDNVLHNAYYVEAVRAQRTGRSGMPQKHGMIRVYARQRAPVNRIPVFEHFEVDVFPMRIQLTMELYQKAWSYFFPDKKETAVCMRR